MVVWCCHLLSFIIRVTSISDDDNVSHRLVSCYNREKGDGGGQQEEDGGGRDQETCRQADRERESRVRCEIEERERGE